MKKSVIMIVLLIPLLLLGQQTVQGTLSTDTRWYGEVQVKGDVTVPKGVTLSIDPGTRIIIDAKSDATKSGKDPKHVEITILGRILAEGTTNDGRIVFTSSASQPQMYDWYGIIIKNLKEPSRLKHCIIEYGYKGITCYGSSPEISNCEIRYNQYAGVSSEVRSNPIVRNSTLSGNEFAGLLCELASNPVVEKNVISQNLNGIVIFDRSQPDLGRLSAAEGESVGENIILNNFETNIYNNSTIEIYAQNNIWNTTGEAQIQETVFDNAQNPSKGKVLFMPVFGGSAAAQKKILAQQEEEKKAEKETSAEEPAPVAAKVALVTSQVSTTPAQNKPAGNTVSNATNKPANQVPLENPQLHVDSTQYLAANDNAAGTALIPAMTENPTDNPPAIVQPETLYVYKEVPMEKVEEKEPEIIEPVIEALLDQGRREYINRVNPEYPSMYVKTGFEGRVFLEVTVGRDGKVEDNRVLRSDGDLFTQSARDAIKKYKYKTATYQGKPVKFKIVELFIFKLN